jgi:hypothetical protein
MKTDVFGLGFAVGMVEVKSDADSRSLAAVESERARAPDLHPSSTQMQA